MQKMLINTLLVIYLIGVGYWMLFVTLTAAYPDNPFIPIYTEITGIDPDFIAKPYVPKEIKTFNDFLYSDYFYKFISIAALTSVVPGIFILGKKRNIFERVILLQAFALPRQRDYWGRVIDKNSNEPIAFSVVRIVKIDENNESLISESIADLDGRYRMYLPKFDDTYHIEVKSTGYKTYRAKIKDEYIGANNEVKTNIFLERENEYISPFKKIYRKYIGNLFNILMLFTLVISLITFLHSLYGILVHFNLISLGNFFFYGFAAPWNIFVLTERLRLRPGKIKNIRDYVPIPNVNLILYKDAQRIDSSLSDENGIVKINVKEGTYLAKVIKPGYLVKYEENDMLEIEVTKDGYLKNNIYMIPVIEGYSQTPKIINPFS